jgi:hypothetical protein
MDKETVVSSKVRVYRLDNLTLKDLERAMKCLHKGVPPRAKDKLLNGLGLKDWMVITGLLESLMKERTEAPLH